MAKGALSRACSLISAAWAKSSYGAIINPLKFRDVLKCVLLYISAMDEKVTLPLRGRGAAENPGIALKRFATSGQQTIRPTTDRGRRRNSSATTRARLSPPTIVRTSPSTRASIPTAAASTAASIALPALSTSIWACPRAWTSRPRFSSRKTRRELLRRELLRRRRGSRNSWPSAA